MLNANNTILLKPKYDVVFQSLFSDKNKIETGYFISAILGTKINVLKVQTEVSQIRELPQEKIGRLDLLAESSDKSLIHIELQLVDYFNTIPRLLYSSCQLISKQLSRGDNYSNLKKTITIGLLNYELEELKDLNKMHTIWHFYEDNHKEKQLTNLQELHIIDMTKANFTYNKNHNDILAQWILFILDPNQREVKSIMGENKELKQTNKKLENISHDEDIKKQAEILERWEREEKWNKTSVYEKGITEGEKSEKEKIVKSMLKENLPINMISRITGLSEKEIKKFIV